jgi:S-adenosyl-L-methionine hydrolase (adenosine-forming)
VIERARGCVFLLTDYGVADELAGVLKAVVARSAPGAPLVDLTHGVSAFDVRAGALALSRAVPYLGPGVVIAVVDPGVATDRRAVALEVATEVGPSHLVGPDNGLLVWAAEALGDVSHAVEIGSSPSRSTFDGRDVFAPAAGALWSGTSLSELGPPIDPHSLVRLTQPVLSVSRGEVGTEVLWVDTFGNVQLSATPSDAHKAGVCDRLGEDLEVITPTTRSAARRVSAFSDLGAGELGVVTDANGHLALAGDRSSAARTLGLRAGDPVKLVARASKSGGRS